MTNRQVGRVNQQSKGETPLMSGVLQRAAVRAVADKEVEGTQEVESGRLSQSRFVHDFSQVPIGGGGLPIIQAKLMIGAAGDRYEQEADRVAKDVVSRMNAPVSPTVQREEISEVEEEELQKKPIVQRVSDVGGMAASSELEASIQGARGSGQPLYPSVREPIEREFGADFSGVRVHTDAKSDELNRSIQAKAFTTGQDIFFRQGAYEPESRDGQELLVHELTHVVQQKASTSQEKVRRKIGIELETLVRVDKNGEDPGDGANFELFKEKGLTGVTDHASNYFKGYKHKTILELVTKETETENRDAQLQQIKEAVKLAQEIETKTDNLKKPVSLSEIVSSVPDKDIMVGDNGKGDQTTDAYVQINVGIDIAKLPDLLTLPSDDFITMVKPKKSQKFDYYKNRKAEAAKDKGKKKEKTVTRDAEVVRNEAKIDAIDILESYEKGISNTYVNLRGLISLMLLYLKMGNSFYPGLLDKNLSPFLSRTDLGDLFKGTLTKKEKEFVKTNKDDLANKLLKSADRKDIQLLMQYQFNYQVSGKHKLLTCKQFVDRIFEGKSDGYTEKLDKGEFKQLGPEHAGIEETPPTQEGNIKPEATTGSKQHSSEEDDVKKDSRRLGPVIEIRQSSRSKPKDKIKAHNGRFPKEEWEKLTHYWIDQSEKINKLRADGIEAVDK